MVLSIYYGTVAIYFFKFLKSEYSIIYTVLTTSNSMEEEHHILPYLVS